jgi:membrane protein DedA with SNARE-associated domain
VEFIVYWISHYGYGALFVLLVLGIVGVPVPDEILLTFSGYMIFKGEFTPLPTLVVAALGSFVGTSLSYVMGRKFGLYLLRRLGRYVHLDEVRIEKLQRAFLHWGQWFLVFGYFLPGVRHLAAYMAGMANFRFARFALFVYTGGFV